MCQTHIEKKHLKNQTISEIKLVQHEHFQT